MTSSATLDARQAVPDRKPRPDPRSILLVGEDPLLSRAVARMLRDAGYVVLTPEVSECPGVDGGPQRVGDAAPPTALVIVDTADERGGRERKAATTRGPGGTWPTSQSVLWISNAGEPATESQQRLVTPFTGRQLLAKVEALLGNGARAR